MRRRIRRIALALVALATPAAADAPPRPPGELRALVIGVDDYRHLPRLHGALADARDIEHSLRGLGVRDMQVMLNADATRRAVLDALNALSARVMPGDTVFLTIAGHGAQEPERVRGSEADGMDEVFLLPAFDPAAPQAASEKILDKEFIHYIRRFEASGARVVFVDDACSGGGMSRSVDARSGALAYRSVSYGPVRDTLQSVADRDDAFTTSADLHHSLFLAAVDKHSRAPELRIPGVGVRGGLSYAFARAVEGAADLNRDGIVTASEMFAYVRQVAHELSDQRQVVVLTAPDEGDPKLYAVASLSRGISVRPADAPPQTSAGLTILPADTDADGDSRFKDVASIPVADAPTRPAPQSALALPVQKPPPQTRPGAAGGVDGTIRVASLDGKTGYFASLQQQPVVLVAPGADPDLVWDPRTQDVLSGADIIARNVPADELPGVVERSLIIKALKTRGAKASQPITMLPGDDLHTKGTRIEIEVGQLTNRYLVLFDISGNGSAQLLYPLGSDPPQRPDASYGVEFQVREPFGADHIVAVTSSQRLVDLEKLIKQSPRRLSPDRLSEALGRNDAQNVRVGFVGLFTTP